VGGCHSDHLAGGWRLSIISSRRASWSPPARNWPGRGRALARYGPGPARNGGCHRSPAPAAGRRSPSPASSHNCPAWPAPAASEKSQIIGRWTTTSTTSRGEGIPVDDWRSCLCREERACRRRVNPVPVPAAGNRVHIGPPLTAPRAISVRLRAEMTIRRTAVMRAPPYPAAQQFVTGAAAARYGRSRIILRACAPGRSSPPPGLLSPLWPR